jgi:hypothetical protein
MRGADAREVLRWWLGSSAELVVPVMRRLGGDDVDEKTLQFLKLLREQVRGKNSREVYTGGAARDLGIEPGDPEYEILLTDLLRAGYVLPNADQNLTAQGAHQITDEGIAAADES